MTDVPPTPDPDDAIRRALQAEADGVEASEALLDRTMAAAARPAVRPGRRLLAAAAVAAIAIGAVVAVATDDDEQQVDAANDPSSTTVTSDPEAPALGLADLLGTVFACDESIQTAVFVDAGSTAEEQAAVLAVLSRDGRQPITATSEQVSARLLDRYAEDPEALAIIEASDLPMGMAVASTDLDAALALRAEVSDLPGVQQVVSHECRDSTSGERPMTVALVREDGWLVVVELTTGEERQLYFGGDPQASSDVPEGGLFIDAVDISPDGEWVYFSTCCEPASGVTYRIPIAGGEPEQVTFGAYPRVSPDGRFLATATGEQVTITPIDGGEPVSAPFGCCATRLAWSPDGRQLAMVEFLGDAGVEAQVHLYDWDGTSLTPTDPGKPDNPGPFVAWTADGVPTTISGGGSVSSYRSLAQDGSYRWLLWVDGEGVVREQAGLESGELPEITGLPEALSADW